MDHLPFGTPEVYFRWISSRVFTLRALARDSSIRVERKYHSDNLKMIYIENIMFIQQSKMVECDIIL